MFVTTRESGARRRSKVYSNTKAARSSRFSLLSAFTAATEGSGGSNSTITQESYLRAAGKPSSGRRRKTRHRHHRSSKGEVLHGRNISVDVFDFLVEDKKPQSDQGTEPDEIVEDSTDEEDIKEAQPEDFYRNVTEPGTEDSTYGSLSGSVKGRRLPSLPEESPSRPLSTHSYRGRSMDLVYVDPRWHWNTASPMPPQVPYSVEGYIPPPCPPPPPAVPYHEMPSFYHDSCLNPQVPPMYADINHEPKIGVRESVDSNHQPDCFRSFAKVSTRLLLQIQVDIAQLESELRELDEDFDGLSEARDGLGYDGYCSPNRQYFPRRGEIYQELYFKLDQYYQLLATSNKVENMSRPVSSEELHGYRRWLETRLSPSSRLPNLVGSDVRTFSASQNLHSSTLLDNRLALTFGAFLYAFLPLLSFRFVTGVLNRLTMLIIFLVIGLLMQDRLGATVQQIEMTCIMAFVCFSIIAAILL